MTLIVVSRVPEGLAPEPIKLPRGGTRYRFDQSVEHFWMHVDVRGPDDCWPWTGSRSEEGYGRWASPYWPGDTYAHRISYRMAKGPIPKGHEIDHECHNLAGCFAGDDCPHRPCQNFDHLLAVTLPTNRRSHPARPRPEKCRHGHQLDEANTYVNPLTGKWACRECTRASMRRWHERNREAQNAKRAARRRKSA